MNTIQKTDTFIIKSYGRLPLELAGGAGVTATVPDSGSLIDLGSGIGANSLGYCDPDWVEAVCTQTRTLQHTSNYYYTQPQADFAEKLCAATGYTNMFLCNSGAEANECAIKTARKYSFDKYGGGRSKILTLKNSFHGRTLTTLTATGQDDMHPECFAPYMPGFDYAEANNIAELTEKLGGIKGDVCAVMLEYVQGEGGVIPLDKEYVDALYTLCKEKDVLVIADEVQTGAGRTGKFLAGEWFGQKADITTMAKGLFGGLPGGACLFGEKCKDVLTPGTHGSTFGGNPVVAAGGLVVLNKVTCPEFLQKVGDKGGYIRRELGKLDEVAAIDGLGLMLGITLKSKPAANVMKTALEKGVLALTAKTKLRLLPPLNIPQEELKKGIDILKEIIDRGSAPDPA